MTITHETLELAALAAGHEIDPTMQTDSGGLCIVGSDDDWMPHTDIADAARLAAKLQIDVAFGYHVAHKVYASRSASSPPCPVSVAHGSTQPDKERAYCHAVTLCAAEIGRRMKGGA